MTPVKSVRTLQFRGQNRQKEGNMLWFVPYAFVFFLKICQMVICPVRGTYNNAGIYFVEERTNSA